MHRVHAPLRTMSENDVRLTLLTCMVSSCVALVGIAAERASASIRSATCRASCSLATVTFGCMHTMTRRSRFQEIQIQLVLEPAEAMHQAMQSA